VPFINAQDVSQPGALLGPALPMEIFASEKGHELRQTRKTEDDEKVRVSSPSDSALPIHKLVETWTLSALCMSLWWILPEGMQNMVPYTILKPLKSAMKRAAQDRTIEGTQPLSWNFSFRSASQVETILSALRMMPLRICSQVRTERCRIMMYIAEHQVQRS
jgi:hypothetical protein